MVVVTRSRAIADTEVVVADRQLDQMNTSTECSPSPDLAPEAAYDACDACRPPVDSLPKPAKVSLYSSWRRKRKYRGTFGYFGSDAPYYGCPVLLKVAALIGISVICVLGCVQAETARPRVLFALGVIWATRVLVGVFVLWQRHIGWLEAIVDSCMLEPLSICSMIVLPVHFQSDTGVDIHLVLGGTLSALAAGVNIYSELYRHWKRGLVTTGLYSWVRHPNYTAEVMSFVGYAWAGGGTAAVVNMWIPLLMLLGMQLWSVNDLECYLEHHYGKCAVERWKHDTPVAIFWSSL